MNKTHKKLHSLVNVLSPLSPLAAGILMKIVFTLSPSGSCYSYNVQALFCMWWKKFGSVFVRVILRTWQLNGEKVNTNLLQNLFFVFNFSFSSLENLGRRQRQNFPYNLEILLKYFYILLRSLVFRCVPFQKLIVTIIIFVIFVIFKFPKISP